MKTHILRGSRQEIVEGLARIRGEVREAIVFEEERTTARPETASADSADIFAEMRPYMVDVTVFDDSRETIYSQQEGE
jgi:hypothetical protein